jgi:hypothetical protein
MGIITPDLSGIVDGQVADAADFTTPFNTITNVINGSLDSDNLADNAVTTAKITAANVTTPKLEAQIQYAWFDPNETWSYLSASTITVPSGAASRYSVGDKIKLTQTTVKYFYITAVADTVLTVTGGSDYTVANAAITANYYSKSTSPVGFPQYFNWTPSWTNLTVGNGVTVARFAIIGRMVRYHIDFTLKSGSSVGAGVSVTFPVTGGASNQLIYGEAIYVSSGTGYTKGCIFEDNALRIYTSDGTYVTIATVTTTTPFTWKTNDNISIEGSYLI